MSTKNRLFHALTNEFDTSSLHFGASACLVETRKTVIRKNPTWADESPGSTDKNTTSADFAEEMI